MKTLALECSSSRRSVAVASGNRIVAHVCHQGGRSDALLEWIQAALDQAGLRPGEIERLAIGLGPGSHTGIRSALATIQGWHLAHGIPCHGLDTSTLLAWQEWTTGRRGTLQLGFDAQRGEVATMSWELLPDGPGRAPTFHLIPASELKSTSSGSTPWHGPDLEQLLPGSIPLWPDARSLACLAPTLVPSQPPETFNPFALRETSFVKAPPGRSVPSSPSKQADGSGGWDVSGSTNG